MFGFWYRDRMRVQNLHFNISHLKIEIKENVCLGIRITVPKINSESFETLMYSLITNGVRQDQVIL